MKKGQIEYMETIFVLLILTIIIFIGVILIYSFYSKSLNEKGEEFTDIDAVTLTSSIIAMPEFTCGKNTNCIDALNIWAFQQTIHNNPHYKAFFNDKDITLEIIYPTTTKKECTDIEVKQEGFPQNCNYFILYKATTTKKNREIIQTPVQLYIPSLNKRALGILNIIVYKP